MKKIDMLAKLDCIVMTLLFGIAILGNIDVKSSNVDLRDELKSKNVEITAVNQKVEQLQMDYASLQLQVQELSK